MISKWKQISSKRQRSIVLGSLIGIMLLMVIGYAAFSSQLKINGTSNITSNWLVKITNITSDLHGATNAVDPSYTDTTASFSTNLTSPGDYAEYTITVENQGDIDATLSNIDVNTGENEAILFETSGIEEGSNLLQGEEAQLIVKVSYNENVTSQPEVTTNNITVTLTYEQATGGSVPEEPTGGNAGSDLVDQAGVVETGDGLYKDSYESNVYTYRGSNPNNYVTFNDETWRIISANTSDNTIKIIRNDVLEDRQFDTESGRYQGSSGYCNDDNYGCNIWGSSSTLYNSSLSPITTLGREYNGTAYTLPTAEADLNTYLNGTYYNGLNSTAKSMIKEDAVYKVGVLYYNNTSMSQDMAQVNAAKWKGKVGLIDATEYVRASTYSSCTDVDAAYDTTHCKNNNWMFNSDIWWTMSPHSYGSSYYVWSVGGGFRTISANGTAGVRPVLTLSSEVQITGGAGTSSSPYTLELNSGQF